MQAESLKTYRAGTHRIVPPEVTLGRMRPLLQALGITRIANVTGLDYIGIPVCMAVRPASRNLSVLQGKGLSLEAAKASAIMEAVESFSSEQPGPAREWAALEREADASYLLPHNLLRRAIDPGARVPWVPGADLLGGRTVLVPEELVRTDFSVPQPDGYGWFLSGSNGIASGNSLAEAQLHAVCELVERDAYSLWRQAPVDRRRASRVDPSSCHDHDVQRLLGFMSVAGMAIGVYDISSDIGIPCFNCVIDDRRGRPPFLGLFGGTGCHPSAPIALCRALTEAAQSRLTSIVGAREDIPPASYAMTGWDFNVASALARRGRASPEPRPISMTSSIETDTVQGDLERVLGRLSRAGVEHIVAVDLTDPEFGVPCVRVVTDALEGQFDKPGYKCGPRAERQGRKCK